MKKATRYLLILCAASGFGALNSSAQVATGGDYALKQAVVASGGGQNTGGAGFSVDGTLGQPFAGAPASGAGFSLAGGFWTPETLAPTAASVSVGGRVLTADGRSLQNARVTLTRSNGETLSTVTSSFGYFRFTDIPAGEIVTLVVNAKRYSFAPQVLNVADNVEGLDLTAIEPF